MRSARGLVCTVGLVRTAGVLACLLTALGSADAATIVVPAGGNLQTAINAAQPGDVIELQAGATYIGNFVLPVKSSTLEITIRSTPDARLPGPGRRINPTLHRALLAKIRSGNTMPAIVTAAGAHHWRLELLEFGPTTGGYGEIIRLGVGGAEQSSLSVVPYALVIDRCYIAGDPLQGQKRGIALNSASTQIVNSYIADIKGVGMDTQAICGWNGPGPYRIENNYLEGAGENVMFGGADPVIAGLVPSDITLRLNHLSKPPAWQQPIVGTPTATATSVAGGGTLPAGTYGYRVVARRSVGQGVMGASLASTQVNATLSTVGSVRVIWSAVPTATEYRVYGRAPGGSTMYWVVTGTSFIDAGTAGTAGAVLGATYWTVKNIFELKNARRVLAEGNVFENNWIGAQTGVAIAFTPRNQGGTAPWSEVSDITFRYNIVRRVGGGINVNGFDNNSPSQQGRNIAITDNLLYEINTTGGSAGRFLQLGSEPSTVIVEHNTVLQSGTLVFAYTRRPDGTFEVVNGFRFANNLALHSTYGILGEGAGGTGTQSILAYFLSPSSVVRNVMAGGQASLYPADNQFPSVATLMSSFVDTSYRLTSNSPYKNAGTDGRDLGADIDRIQDLTNRAISGDATSTTTTNAPPTADAGGPYAAPSLTTVTFQGGGSSDPDGTVVSYVWNWGDGTPDGSGVTATHQYGRSGSYTATLTVTDDSGASASATVPVSISNRPPTANAGGPYAFQPGTAFTADGRGSSDLDGTIASYRWSWGDGSADTVSASATASHTYATAGTYSIQLRVTDDQGAQASASTTAGAGAQTAADLILTSLTAPATGAVGGTLTLSDTTSNQGGSTPTGSSTSFYLSANLVLDASDILMGSRSVPPLAAGAAHAGSAAVTVPASTPIGSYYVIARTDAGDAIAESVETNNTRSTGPMGIGPDLVMSAVSAPATARSGGSVSVNSTTRNQGAGAAAASATVFYLSSNTILDAADPLVGSRAVPALASGATSAGSASVTIPAATATGTYYLFAKADGNNVVVESAENNNAFAAVQVRIGPDLAITTMTVPATASRGATFNVSDTTSNQGAAAIAASTTRFYLSTNTILDAGDVLLGSRAVPALGAGLSSTATTALVIPASRPPGVYVLLAIADGPGTLVEASETNNTQVRSIHVQ